MKLYFSSSTLGFYDSEINESIPSDAVEITREAHADLLQAQSLGKVIKADVDGAAIAIDRAPPSIGELQAMLTVIVQAHMDAAAQKRGYDSLLSAVSYAEESSVALFQAEGKAFRAWRSKVWEACYKMLADVQQGKGAVPTEEELITALPKVAL